jgi:hypothetical protein
MPASRPGSRVLYQINFRLPGTILTKQLELARRFRRPNEQSGLPLQVTPSEP